MSERVAIEKFNSEVYKYIDGPIKDFQKKNNGYYGVDISKNYFYELIKDVFSNYKYDNRVDKYYLETFIDGKIRKEYKEIKKIYLDLVDVETKNLIINSLNLFKEERKNKINFTENSKNSRIKLYAKVDKEIETIVNENPLLSIEKFNNTDKGMQDNIVDELEVNFIGLKDRCVIESEEYKIWDIDNKELQEVISKHINKRRDLILNELKAIEIYKESEKNLKRKFVSFYENMKKDTELIEDFEKCNSNLKNTVVKQMNLKPIYSDAKTFYNFEMLEEDILSEVFIKLVNSLKNERDIKEASINTLRDLNQYVDEKIMNSAKENSLVYNLDSQDCFSFIKREVQHDNNLYEKSLANIELLNIDNNVYSKFDVENADTKSYLDNLYNKFIDKTMCEESQSNDIDTISFRFTNSLNEKLKLFDKKDIYFKGKILTYKIYNSIKKIIQIDGKYNTLYYNKELSILNNEELEKVFSDFKYLDRELEKQLKKNVLVSEDYDGEYLTSNCLVANSKYDESYIYCNLVGGAEVFREHGKLCLKVSKDAKVERKLKPIEIEKRLKSTYQLDKNTCFSNIFDDNNIINSTINKFSPHVHADNYIDKVTLENCRNTAMNITYNKEVDETCFPTTYALLNGITNNKEVGVNRVIDNTAYYLQNKESSDVQLLLHGVYGDAVEILYTNVYEPLFGSSQSVKIAGDMLLDMNEEKIQYILDNNKLIYISKIPTISDPEKQKELQYTLNKFCNDCHSYNFLLINAHETEGLNLNLNKNGLDVINVNNIIQSMDCFKGIGLKKLNRLLKEERESFNKFIFTKDINDDEINTALENNDKLELLKSKNRYREFILIIKRATLEPLKFLLAIGQDELYDKIALGFKAKKRYIEKCLLAELYNALEKPDVDITTNGIMKIMRALDEEFFDEKLNATKQKNNYRFTIDSIYNDLID